MIGQIHFTVPGNPISQGSMNVGKNGQVYHSNGDLVPWRQKVLDVALLHARQAGWELPLDEPLMVGVVFYLPKPRKPKFDVPATGYDLDKLQRAVGDALSPSKGQRVIINDNRICKWLDPEKRYAKSPGEERAEILIIRQNIPW